MGGSVGNFGGAASSGSTGGGKSSGLGSQGMQTSPYGQQSFQPSGFGGKSSGLGQMGMMNSPYGMGGGFNPYGGFGGGYGGGLGGFGGKSSGLGQLGMMNSPYGQMGFNPYAGSFGSPFGGYGMQQPMNPYAQPPRSQYNPGKPAPGTAGSPFNADLSYAQPATPTQGPVPQGGYDAYGNENMNSAIGSTPMLADYGGGPEGSMFNHPRFNPTYMDNKPRPQLAADTFQSQTNREPLGIADALQQIRAAQANRPTQQNTPATPQLQQQSFDYSNFRPDMFIDPSKAGWQQSNPVLRPSGIGRGVFNMLNGTPSNNYTDASGNYWTRMAEGGSVDE
jgi:hypothetical protein